LIRKAQDIDANAQNRRRTNRKYPGGISGLRALDAKGFKIVQKRM